MVRAELVGVVLDQVPKKSAQNGFVLKPVAVAVKGHMDLWVEVQTGTMELGAVVESRLVKMAEEVPVAVSLELEHICLLVEHLREAHCTVTDPVGSVAASCAAQLVVTTVMLEEHKHSMLMIQVDLEEGVTARGQLFWGTKCGKEHLLWVEEEPGELISVRSQRVAPSAVAMDPEVRVLAGQRKVMLLAEKAHLECHDAKLELLQSYLGCRSNWTCSTPWMVVGSPETDWKLVVEEAPSWIESHQIVVEQAFLDLASAVIAESFQQGHMDFAVELVVEAHRDLPKQLQEEHMHWRAEQAQKLHKTEPEE